MKNIVFLISLCLVLAGLSACGDKDKGVNTDKHDGKFRGQINTTEFWNDLQTQQFVPIWRESDEILHQMVMLFTNSDINSVGPIYNDNNYDYSEYGGGAWMIGKVRLHGGLGNGWDKHDVRHDSRILFEFQDEFYLDGDVNQPIWVVFDHGASGHVAQNFAHITFKDDIGEIHIEGPFDSEVFDATIRFQNKGNFGGATGFFNSRMRVCDFFDCTGR